MQITKHTAVKIIVLNLWTISFILGISFFITIRKAHRFDDIFVYAGERYGIDPKLISSVVWKESRYKPYAEGAAGEIGLMQVLEPAAREWAEAEDIKDFKVKDLYNPVTNVMSGAWYLAKGVNHWSNKKDPLPYALAQYNAGRSRVLDWTDPPPETDELFWKQIPFPTTKQYVKDILERYRGGI